MSYSETVRLVSSDSDPVNQGSQGGSEDLGDSWLRRYESRLTFTNTGRNILLEDTQNILDNCIFKNGEPGADSSNWPEGRLQRGLVVGAVQSGKTASMLAVSAGAVDRGVDFVVLLSGTRTALWKQTATRTIEQLDGWSREADNAKKKHRVLLPKPARFLGSAEVPLDNLYSVEPTFVVRQLGKKKPLIAIVMKQSDHLMAFRKQFHDLIQRAVDKLKRPLNLLVIDDECDDGSIIDTASERSIPLEDRKNIPRFIAQLWSGAGVNPNHATFNEYLYATYLGYTATPAANVLQDSHNPLAPTDFVVSLRTPYDSGAIASPRNITFFEPEGVQRYYTGGDIFYKDLSEDGNSLLLEDTVFPLADDFETADDFDNEVDRLRYSMLGDGLRAYLIAAASSLFASGKRLAATRQKEPSSKEELLKVLPEPLSMLVHPSFQQIEHEEFFNRILWWALNKPMEDFNVELLKEECNGSTKLSTVGLVARLENEENEWVAWLDSYAQTRRRISLLPGGERLPEATADDWDEIKRLLIDEVFPFVELRIINSDPETDDRPLFSLMQCEDGNFLPPKDIFTIFVSGNVMSRGVTLDGLVTTVFLRNSSQPIADTQMQMQRWFGYRGSILPWCRLFGFTDQIELFKQYHEKDTAMRLGIINAMNADPQSSPSPIVLQTLNTVATAKISNLGTLPICPGASPFVRLVDFEDECSKINNNILVELLNEDSWLSVDVGGKKRGTICERPKSLLEVAVILEQFRYHHYQPNMSSKEFERWKSLSDQLGLDEPLLKTPKYEGGVTEVTPNSCPYTIAAYLRFWHAMQNLKNPGFYPTDNSGINWRDRNIRSYLATEPKFFVGVRYGNGGTSKDPSLAAFGLQRMQRAHTDGVLTATWGSRNPGQGPDRYFGDEWFDYHFHGRPLPHVPHGEPTWRPRGEPGLVLFHLIKPRNEDEEDGLTVGVCLPKGGPDQMQVLRT